MKKIITAAVFAAAVAASAFLYQKADNKHCANFVRNLDVNCDSISQLGDYIDYDMLSKDLKQHIDESDFKFSTNEETVRFCDKFKDLDYEYEIRDWNYIYPTYKYGRLYDVLAQDINIDGTIYNVTIDLVFKPSPFFRPEIVDLRTTVSLV